MVLAPAVVVLEWTWTLRVTRPQTATRQMDFVFASTGLRKRLTVRALNTDYERSGASRFTSLRTSHAMVKLALILHLLGASVWVGGHLVLSLGFLPRALRRRDPAVILGFEERFERLGIPALLLQIATGLFLAQRYVPVGQWLLFSDHLSRMVGLKLVLLAVTLALAVDARLRLIPTLDERKLGSLAAHIVAVTLVGILFVVVGVGVRTGSLF